MITEGASAPFFSRRIYVTYKLIVAGSRGWNSYESLREGVDAFIEEFVPPETEVEIVSGTAAGADTLGERYAKEKGYALTRMPAEWNVHGKAAGAIRNTLMAKYADGCAIFWDGTSRGSAHMSKEAENHNLDRMLCTDKTPKMPEKAL